MSGGLIRSPGLPKDATVVVIGGGVMGASTAYQLARAGIRGLVLLEANELASGSSGKPLGGVRAQFSNSANIELGARSLRAFRRFDEHFGVDIGYQQVGYLSSCVTRPTSPVTGPALSCRTPSASAAA
jgi:sarcosine oxidase, subunit beta